jgi:hypothetical protein
MGYSIDWLPDGRVAGDRVGAAPRAARRGVGAHADLSKLADRWNEPVLDSRGDVYGDSSHGPAAGALPASPRSSPPDGSARRPLLKPRTPLPPLP